MTYKDWSAQNDTLEKILPKVPLVTIATAAGVIFRERDNSAIQYSISMGWDTGKLVLAKSEYGPNFHYFASFPIGLELAFSLGRLVANWDFKHDTRSDK